MLFETKLLSKYTVSTMDGLVGDLKIHSLGDGEYAFAVSGKAKPDGSIYNPEKADKPHSSGRLYKAPFVRHWDHYVTENRNAIWLGRLGLKDSESSHRLESKHKLKNALKGTNLE